MFKITRAEFLLATIFALMGLIFSHKFFLIWLNTLNPIAGLLFYYLVLFLTITLLSHFGLVISGIKIKKPLQFFGTLLIIFSFFIIVNWESPFINYQVYGSLPDSSQFSQILFQSEDGATFYFWSTIIGVSTDLAGILTYVITPFILTLIGAFFVIEKPRLGVS